MTWTSGAQILQQTFHSSGVDNDRFFAEDLNQFIMVMRGNYIVNPDGGDCAPAVGGTTDLTSAGTHLTIAGGTSFNNGAKRTISAANIDLSAAHTALTAGQARIVLVYITSAGAVATSSGTAVTAGNHLPPEFPENCTPVCWVYLAEGDDVMTSDQIYDCRYPAPVGQYINGISLIYGNQDIFASDQVRIYDPDDSNALLSDFDTTNRTYDIFNSADPGITTHYGNIIVNSALFGVDKNPSTANASLGAYEGRWNGSTVASVSMRSGPDTTNKDDGYIAFYTSNGGSVTEKVRISYDGKLQMGGTPSISYGDFYIETANPILALYESDGAANAKLWVVSNNNGDLQFLSRTDTGASQNTFLTMDRGVPSLIAGVDLDLNGNTIYSSAGQLFIDDDILIGGLTGNSFTLQINNSEAGNPGLLVDSFANNALITRIQSNMTTPSTSDYFVGFYDNTSTLIGSISGTGGGDVAYNTFTGAHLSQSLNYDEYWEYGMIVVTTGDKINDDYKIYCDLSTTFKDSGALGVFVDDDREVQDRVSYKRNKEGKIILDYLGEPIIERKGTKHRGLKSGVHALTVNALGEGMILVTNEFANVNKDDYVTTSQIPGVGTSQGCNVLHNYTVAKITQKINWDKIKINPKFGVKTALVACTYHCG